MKRVLQAFVLTFVLLFVVLPVDAQRYPLPGAKGDPDVICTNCKLADGSESLNPHMQTNTGLKTWPYDSPISSHVGRIVDSTVVTDFQGPFRTARAKKIRLARTQRGSAPPRAYVQIGSAVAAYDLNTFFTTTLPKPMVDIGVVAGSFNRIGYPNEKVAGWDAYIYPEARGSGWVTSMLDGQDRLADFDYDDRGYVYVGTGSHFGFGIHRDSGEKNSGLLPLIKQIQTGDVGTGNTFVIKAGSKYYYVISSSRGRQVWDVTTPSAPVAAGTLLGAAHSINSWDKDEPNQRVAIRTAEGNIEIWENSRMASGGSPIAQFSPSNGDKFFDVSVDDAGNVWTAKASKNGKASIVKFTRGASSYTMSTFDNALPSSFAISTADRSVNYGDKYLTVIGQILANGGYSFDVRLFKLENNAPVEVPTDNYFAKYYHSAAPVDYANTPNRISNSFGAYPIKWNNKMYLIYQAYYLGDVYEIEAGDSISATRKSGTFGNANPNSKQGSGTGPFYGDILKYTSTSSNQQFQYNVEWSFGNPESGTSNSAFSKTGQDVVHQFTGLSTEASIKAARKVTVKVSSDESMNDTVDVVLAVPTARIGVQGTSALVVSNGATADVVAGDRFIDASDGEIEGHHSSWNIDGTVTNQPPDASIDVGAIGPHVASLSARYGAYDASFATTGAPFVKTVSNLSYVVRPFLVAMAPATSSSSATGPVTFKGTARSTTDTSVLLTNTWTVTWSLKSGSVDLVPLQTSTVAVGTVPDFTVANKSLITSGSILKLTVSVPTTGLSAAAAAYAEHSVTQELVPPDAQITRTGCENTGSPCSFVVKSASNRPTTDWTVTWTLSGPETKTGTGLTFAHTPGTPGNYTVTVQASTKLFAASVNQTFTVEGPICGDPPASTQMSVWTSCTSCTAGETVSISADPYHYTLQGCEEFLWEYGDGGTATTSTPDTTRSYTSSGSKTIRLRVKKGSQTSSAFTKTITIGATQPPPPPPPVCTAPSNIQITYSGSQGCSTGQNCRAGERVTFNVRRGSSSLHNCDSVAWTFHDATTSSSSSPNKTYSTAGSYSVAAVVTNQYGTSSKTISVSVTAGQQQACSAPPTDRQLMVEFTGRTSGCRNGASINCQLGETIDFRAIPFQYDFQDCDNFEWDFGDGSAKKTTEDATHSYSTAASAYRVKLRVYNSSNQTGTTISVDVPFSNVPAKPQPVLAFAGFPAQGSKGAPVSFTVNSNIDATGWEWSFGDGTAIDRSKASAIGKSSANTHTFANAGTYSVTVRARNADDTSAAALAIATGTIVVSDVPEYRYLLPVVTHIGGQNGSSWRTDIQIYYPDPNVSPQHPTTATVQFKDFAPRDLTIFASTMILEDYMRTITPVDDAGPMIISVRSMYAPQIWTRTYNQTSEGTFGQFIPAIRLDAAGGGAAVGEGTYYLAGLRSDARYRTNIGFVNPSTAAMTATIRVYDDQRTPIGQFTRTLAPLQLDQITNLRGILANLPLDHPFTMEIDVPAGQWLIAYASFIDGGSNDPVYIQAVRSSDLSSPDNKEIIIPGVGHTGAWRSDVTIFNPDSQQVNVDLEYLDATGNKVGEAKSVPIRQGEFVQYEDVIKQGILGGSVPDGLGMLRLKVIDSPIPNAHFPMAFARTYNDEGTGKTYGQGISGFASAKANVKPGRPALIPGIRSTAAYVTNIGLSNTTSTPATVTVKMLDPMTGAESVVMSVQLAAFQSLVGRLPNPGAIERGSLKIEVTGGSVWAFASIIDQGTKDPEYIPATPLAQ